MAIGAAVEGSKVLFEHKKFFGNVWCLESVYKKEISTKNEKAYITIPIFLQFFCTTFVKN